MNSTVMHGDDLYFSEQDLSVIHRKNSLIIWNVLNYFITYANEANWEPGHVTRNMDHVTGSALDWWINARTQELINSVTDYLDQYDTVRATKTIEAYVNDLSTWYVRRSRGRKDQEFFSTLYQVLLTFSKVIAPVMPYMAERIHRALIDEKSSVHLTKWPESKKLSSGEQDILLKMRLVREIVEEGHSQRKTQGVKVRQPLASLTYSLKDKKPLGEELEQIIASEMNVKLVEFNDHQAKRVEIDWELTLELKQEGLARDLERFIQDLRKKQDLRVGQMVSINWDVSSEGLSGLFDMIDKKKTYVSNLKRQKGLQGKNMETEEGTVTIEIEKA
jgi:isoleucyl-tRNA synthetase